MCLRGRGLGRAGRLVGIHTVRYVWWNRTPRSSRALIREKGLGLVIFATAAPPSTEGRLCHVFGENGHAYAILHGGGINLSAANPDSL
jgi:hypothetical protein